MFAVLTTILTLTRLIFSMVQTKSTNKYFLCTVCVYTQSNDEELILCRMSLKLMFKICSNFKHCTQQVSTVHRIVLAKLRYEILIQRVSCCT